MGDEPPRGGVGDGTIPLPKIQQNQHLTRVLISGNIKNLLARPPHLLSKKKELYRMVIVAASLSFSRNVRQNIYFYSETTIVRLLKSVKQIVN